MEPTDRSYQLMACHYIDSQLIKLSREINGARECRNIECIHQSRVASRRLRAAFGIFENCFPEKMIKKWRRQIKKLTKAFGPARDTDVQLEYLNKIITNLKEDRKKLLPGIKRLLLRTSQRREKYQEKVIKTIDKLESSAILADIHSAIEKILFCIPENKTGLKSEYMFMQTSEHICMRLQELLSCQNCLDDPDDKKGHHSMRIAAKRLRYTMEICREPYDTTLDNAIKVIKKIQTILGDVHDCDVWDEQIDYFKQAELERTKKYFGNEKPFYFLQSGLDYLQQERRQVREHSFRVIVRYWKRLSRQKFWESLESKLRVRQNEQRKPAFEIVEITKRNTGEKAIGKNTSDRGHSRESAGVKSSSE